MRILFLIILVIFSTQIASAQDYYFVTKDTVYNNNIKSVQCQNRNESIDLAILKFQSSSSLNISFDDLDGDDKSYIYKIYHCDRNWELSNLDEIDYLEGFNDEKVREQLYSNTAYSNYTHYHFSLPNKKTNFLISGNYILLVIDDDNDEVVFTRRFMVVDYRMNIDASVGRATNTLEIKNYQKVSLDLKPEQDFTIQDPLKEISVTVLQNARWDNAVYDIAPKYISGNTINFSQFNEFVFPSLTEFRAFDLEDMEVRGYQVEGFYRNGDGIDAQLYIDEPRVLFNYIYTADYNGNYVIRAGENEMGKPNQLEYSTVLFSLETGSKIFDAEIYMVGKFSDWQLKDEYKMYYDSSFRGYTGEAYLKQGYYNYMYASLTEGVMSIASIEGSDLEAENDYYVLIYYHPFGSRYDQLIGVTTINSLRNWKNK